MQIGLAAVSLVLLAVVVAVGLIVSGPVTDAVGDLLHAGGLARTVWSVAKWPVLALVDDGAAVAAVLDRAERAAAPVPLAHPGWRGRPARWVLASFGFGLYVANFGSYDATYGSLGAVIAFLVWLYLSNCALMLGVQVNAELQRGRVLQAGVGGPGASRSCRPGRPADS